MQWTNSVNIYFCFSGICIEVNLLYLTPSGQTTYCSICYPFPTVPNHTFISGSTVDNFLRFSIIQPFPREIWQRASQWRSALVGDCCVSTGCGRVRTIGIDWWHVRNDSNRNLSKWHNLRSVKKQSVSSASCHKYHRWSTVTSNSSMNLYHKFEIIWNLNFLGLVGQKIKWDFVFLLITFYKFA